MTTHRGNSFYICGQSSDDLPHVYKQHSPAFESDSTFLLQRSVTRQDDEQSDVRTQLIQAEKHPYSIFKA